MGEPMQESMHSKNLMRNQSWTLGVLARLLILIAAVSSVMAQNASQPWMNTSLSPEERAALVLKEMTLEEKIALLHGNGMEHAPQWQMPLTHISNGGAGYVEGVKRLGIPPLFISDAAYGVRDSGANGRTRRRCRPVWVRRPAGTRKAPANTAR